MTFNQLPIGSIFFDTLSGEYFSKTDINKAEQISGGSYFEGIITEFGLGDDVELVEGE